jgi:hypothetical protein
MIIKTFKLLFLAIMSFALIGDVSPQTKKRKTVNKIKTKINKINAKPPVGAANANIKTVTEGAYSKVETPFVFVARSAATYTQLQSIVENLPSALDIDFEKTAVVAAFAGTKNTGGYSLDIKNVSNKILLEVTAPPKGAMLTQALTTPYKVALVPVEQEMNLPLEVSANWKNAAQTYQITKGEFESSGGFAGRIEKFDAGGTISVISFGNYATLIFNLSEKGKQNTRKLSETASGTLKEGKIELTQLSAGSFSEGPKPPLKAFGTLTKDKLLLTFEPLPSRVADGFQVLGAIEAVKLR